MIAGDTRRLARVRIAHAIDAIVHMLLSSPAVPLLVDKIVLHLATRAPIELLIDRIVRYLAEQPEVLALLKTQSASFATELVDEARERAVRADDAVDRVLYRRFWRWRRPH